MEGLLLLALLTGCTASPIVGDSSFSAAGAFDSPAASLPVDVTQISACIPDDQLINGIQARSCNDFGFNLADSATNGKISSMANPVSEKNQLNLGLTSPGTSMVSTLHSPYLLADSSGNGGVNLPQLGATALGMAYGLIMACAQSIMNLFSGSGTTHPGGTSTIVEAPASDAETSSTETDGSKTETQRFDPCPFEIYAHRQLALCDIGVQSIQYSELEDMFILRDPTMCEFVSDSLLHLTSAR
ncbi:hypothetical protein MMC07_008706 [Pseudocyphellaria aurata]|nr:hypothetical protein [Pseudocyphellaria aurata]